MKFTRMLFYLCTARVAVRLARRSARLQMLGYLAYSISAVYVSHSSAYSPPLMAPASSGTIINGRSTTVPEGRSQHQLKPAIRQPHFRPIPSDIDIDTMRVRTPLVYSYPVSRLEKAPATYLKLEALQPSGSFKDRGMGTLCEHLKAQGARRLVSSSGGNAGHSAALCGRVVGLPVLVIIPTTTKPLMIEKIRDQGAEVKVYGDNWNTADALARQLVAEDPTSAYLPPYDHPILWEGHSTIVDEIKESGIRPGAIVTSVGGGGLICGVYQGLHRHGWDDVNVVAAETEGAASFAAGFAAGHAVRLERISSLATSLGALEVTPQAIEWSKRIPTVAKVVSDAEAVSAVRNFLGDHRILVEPACGAALALVYTQTHREELQRIACGRPVVIVVCGGSGITPEILVEMEQVTAVKETR